MIYKLFSSCRPKNAPTRTKIYGIATFCLHNLRFTRNTPNEQNSVQTN